MAAGLGAAELRFSRQFTDNMVIQRDQPAIITGFADEGADVTVTFAGQKKTTKVDEQGAWSVTLDPMPANANPQTLTVSSSARNPKAEIRNVLVGDVFLFARQTSIDISLGRNAAGRKAAAAHQKDPLYRAVSIKTIPALKPQSELAAEATTGWAEVDEGSALKMSAAAYYFGRDLLSEVDVPIGIIDLNMGYQFPINWLSRETLMETEKFYGRSGVPGIVGRMEKLADLFSKGEPMPRKEVVKGDPLEYPLYPAAGYNSVIHPLRGTALKGLILQLGNNYPYMCYEKLKETEKKNDRKELNRAYVMTYDTRKVGFRMDSVTTPHIPREWREAFGDPELPIGLIVPPSSALATLALHAREMRELQRQCAAKNPGTGIILPGMESIPFSAQPRDESVLAERCLSWALGAAYEQEGAPASGPLLERVEMNMNKATVCFKKGTAHGLKASNGALDHFEVAGVAGEYAPARASIDGEVIRLKSDTINRIAHVRYNWRSVPDEGLVNAAGLPAIPFRTQDAPYQWFFRHSEDDLPTEYSTPANTWKSGEVTLISGQLKTFGYATFSGWLGPVGIKVGPFGPNMGVREVRAGSPADGKLFVGDQIYSANGRMLGDSTERVMSAAITESETEALGGKLTLGVHREGENLDVELSLKVMGSYSPTSPYDCLKTEKIVADLERYLAERGGGAGFLYSDALFLLGAGSPEYQGLVRRLIYSRIGGSGQGGNNWYLGYEAILMAEYYLATGDRNVLPYLERLGTHIAAAQIKHEGAGNRTGGWYGRGSAARNYPAMAHTGLGCMLGLTLAREGGVLVDEEAYQLGLDYLRRKGAPVGIIIYGDAFRDRPNLIDPQAMLAGKLSSDTGKTSIAAILFDLIGDGRTSYICSLKSVFAYNNTYGHHGGNFWGNFWTPLGANVHGKPAFIHFMKGHRWYRELNRMFDGSLITNESGSRVGGGHGLALVVPRRRLRILGAPASPFAPDARESLKPALEAYAARDYARCEQLAGALLSGGTVGKSEVPTVEKLIQEAQRIQASIASDMSRLEGLIAEGRFHEAKLDIPQLKGVAAEGDARLAAIEKALTGKPRGDDAKLYAEAQKKLKTVKAKPAVTEAPREWKCLTTEVPVGKDTKSLGRVPADQASRWRLRIVEARSQAPEGWTRPGFDDSAWHETSLPISWHLNHTALLRTTFNVKDRKAFDGLRFRAWLFRQQNVKIYLNGHLIGRVNNLLKKTGNVSADFKDGALRHLKNGENALAIVTRQNWRWGMLFMRVYNDGFGFRLDARVKSEM